MSDTEDGSEPADRWVLGDLRLSAVAVTEPFRVPCMVPSAYGSVLHRPYRRVRQCCWYHSVDWQEATAVAADVVPRALARRAACTRTRPGLQVVVDGLLPRGLPLRLRQAVESPAWGQPILASAQAITHGTHRLTAMRNQGVKSTPALLFARAGQRLAEIPGAYPHQLLD